LNRSVKRLVLEPIFEADVPPEQHAYRPGRNAQQAVVEVEALLFRGRPEVVDADLADYFGSFPHFQKQGRGERDRSSDRGSVGGSRAPERLDFPVDETPPR
jgi:hypothetical protein